MDKTKVDAQILRSVRVCGIDACVLEGTRPRVIGCNSRLGSHGPSTRDSIVRIHTTDGSTGWGWADWRRSPARFRALSRALLGKTVAEVFDIENGTQAAFMGFDTPLWDLAGRLLNAPVHTLLGDHGSPEVGVYDGSIYMEDVDWKTGDDRGLEPVLDAVRNGMKLGYRAFKLKLGRGYRWMEENAGFRRDVEVVHAVRELIGTDCALLIDGNNGFSVAQAERLLSETRECSLYWFEEPFEENKVDCLNLKSFIQNQNLGVRIADGESRTPPDAVFTEIVENGGIDVVQFDLRACTISPWKAYMKTIKRVGVLAAPHNWGSFLLNYYVPQFGAGCGHFAMAETDISTVPEIDNSGYQLVNGTLIIPDTPGFGLELDPHGFALALDRLGGFMEFL